MDSIEAFEMVATLHEIIEADIPENIDPASLSTLRQLAGFLLENYSDEKIERLMHDDFEQTLEGMLMSH